MTDEYLPFKGNNLFSEKTDELLHSFKNSHVILCSLGIWTPAPCGKFSKPPSHRYQPTPQPFCLQRAYEPLKKCQRYRMPYILHHHHPILRPSCLPRRHFDGMLKSWQLGHVQPVSPHSLRGHLACFLPKTYNFGQRGLHFN